LLEKGWLSPEDNRKLIADLDRELEADREAAIASPMPDPATTPQEVYCQDGCHHVQPKYGAPASLEAGAASQRESTEAAVHLR
jgi:hypothetical protein